MLEKIETYSSIEIKERGQIQVRKTVRIMEDGIALSENHHREIRYPGQDISDLPENIRGAINAYWTQEVLDAWSVYEAEINSQVELPI